MQEYSQGVPAFFISHGFILLLVPSLCACLKRSHRNHGNHGHIFLVARAQEILEEILFEIWPLARNLSSEFKRILDGNKIFNENH